MRESLIRGFPWITFFTVLLFTVGYVVTVGEFLFHKYLYATILIVVVISIYLVEIKLTKVVLFDMPVLLCLLVFISTCYIKFFLIALNPISPYLLGMLPLPPSGYMYTGYLTNWAYTQMYSLALCTLGLLGWSLSVFFLPIVKTTPVVIFENINKKDFYLIFALAGFLTLTFAYVSYHYSIGVMGKPVEIVLPFHLRGIIYYLNNYFVPCLILLSALCALKINEKMLIYFAVVLLVSHGLINFLVTSSKAAFLGSFLLFLFFLIACEFKINRKNICITFLILFVVLLCIPYMHAIREARVHNRELISSLMMTFTTVGFEPYKQILNGFIWIIYRLPGVEIMTGILAHNGKPLMSDFKDILMSTNGVSGYLTNIVFNIPTSLIHMNAPSYWGWWYLLFGQVGVFLGGVFLAILVRILWPMVLNLRLQTSPILKAFVLMLFFTVITEGTIDSMLRPILATLVSILILETYLYIRFR